MKTAKNIFNGIISFENLLQAARRAALGKRERYYVLEFVDNLEENCLLLQEQLNNKTYRPGAYTTFQIYRPKPRMISAAPFRDRVVHHALMHIAGPILENSFIADSYANRVNKGTHQAILRYQHFLRKHRWVLKCDVRKYFPSIDHVILKDLFRRKIGDEKALWLIDRIIDASNEQQSPTDFFAGDDLFSSLRRRGLPIGNLTSQFFANFYLNPFDHFVKEQLRCPGYLRYVDDFALFGESRHQLREWREAIADFLQNFRLRLNPNRVHLYPSTSETRFLGQVVSRSCRRLPGENVRRFRQRYRRWQIQMPENLEQRISGWQGHALQADTSGLLASAFGTSWKNAFLL